MPNPTGINTIPPKKPSSFTTTDPTLDDAVRPQTGLGSHACEDSLLIGQRAVNGSSATALLNPKAADVQRLEQQYISQCDYLARLQEKQIILQQLDAIRSSIADPENPAVSGQFAINFVTSGGAVISVLPPDPTLDAEELGVLLQRLSLLVGKSGDLNESGELEKAFGKGGHKLEKSLMEVRQAMGQSRGELERLAPESDVLNYQPELAVQYELSPTLPHWTMPEADDSAETDDSAEAIKTPENQERFVFIPTESESVSLPVEPSDSDKDLPMATPAVALSAGDASEITGQNVDLRQRIDEANLFAPDVAHHILKTNKGQISRHRLVFPEIPCTDNKAYSLVNDQVPDMLVYLESGNAEQNRACIQHIIDPLANNLSKRLRDAASGNVTDAEAMNMIYTTLFATNLEQLEHNTDFAIVLSLNNSDWLINRRHSRNIRALCCAHQQSDQQEVVELQADNTDPVVAECLARAIHQIDHINPELLKDTSLLPAVTKLPQTSGVGGYYLLLEGSGPQPLMSDDEKLTFFRDPQGQGPNAVANAVEAELNRRAAASGGINTTIVMNVDP